MSDAITIGRHGLDRWVAMESRQHDAAIERRCSPEVIEKALAGLAGVNVASVTVNTSGTFDPPPPAAQLPLPPETLEMLSQVRVEGLPPYCDVRVHQSTPGGHSAEIVVWVPLVWNGRMLGIGGGGNRTGALWFSMGHGTRSMTPGVAISNGFVAVSTDAGNRDERFAGWGLDPDTRELDRDLIENWVHRSTHEMTTVGRAVAEAIHGEPPSFSYFVGCSGGGRQGLEQAQRYADDYDGIWAAEPAINWSTFIPAEIWPALVMNELGNPVAPAKFEAFRRGVLEEAGDEATRFVPSLEPATFDPFTLVGARTEAGEITELDAQVMHMIWSGPHTQDGNRLWFGLYPGTESWGANAMQTGLAITAPGEDGPEPLPFLIADSYIGAWIKRDPTWDWRTLTMTEFEEVVAASQREFSWLDSNSPDLTELRDSGAKLLVTHGLADEVIFPGGTRQWFDEVLDHMGGLDQTAPFARLFLVPGDGHGHTSAGGPGITMASGMVALMEWVEHGHAPDTLHGDAVDLLTGEVMASGSVEMYLGSSAERASNNPPAEI